MKTIPIPQVDLSGLPIKTWKLNIAYDGTDYFGWQIQPEAKTVQGELLQRLRLLFRCPELKIMGCSRTDAGVHALDQYVSFSAPSPEDYTPEWLKMKLNKWLPEDILIKRVEEAPADFHARFGNHGKAYTYCISPGEKCNPLAARYVWRTPKPLDLDAMRAAAIYLTGEHDFRSFTANSGQVREDTVRHLYRLEVLEKNGLIYVNAVGASFLYKMVRSLAGYLVHVGAGHADPEDTPGILEARNRTKAADSAPAQGLFLAKVFWQPEEWKAYQPVLPPFDLNALP